MPEIYGTLGPRCCETETLCAMLKAGMTGMRLNLSHITLHDAAEEIENLIHTGNFQQSVHVMAWLLAKGNSR